jgi:hypothetical protein
MNIYSNGKAPSNWYDRYKMRNPQGTNITAPKGQPVVNVAVTANMTKRTSFSRRKRPKAIKLTIFQVADGKKAAAEWFMPAHVSNKNAVHATTVRLSFFESA